jgi:DNA modification methylase
MTDEWRYWITEGDCVEVMEAMRPNSIDAIVCDPPYEIAFMGRGWDNAGVAFDIRTWQAAYRLLKPGGHLLAFGAARTYHRMTVAIEDAGFEIRDSIMWLYGQGFPKSHDVSKAIDKAAGAEREVIGHRTDGAGNGSVVGLGSDRSMATEYDETAPATAEAVQWQGWGTALKPAHEPIVVARKPLAGTVAANVLEHGTGALNIDASRIGSSDGGTRSTSRGDQQGRWPANVIMDEERAAELDEQTGTLRSGANPKRRGADGDRTVLGAYAGQADAKPARGADAGGASRFFYVPKPSPAERNRGLPAGEKNTHTTVKPIALMRYLVRLVTPPDGIVLDPFMGSGTTLLGALEEGIRCVGIEKSHEYATIARNRIEWAQS